MRLARTAAIAVGIGLVLSPAASAKNIKVSTLADDFGQGAATCSLREAITAANDDKAFGGCLAGDGSDVILVPGGTYKISKSTKEAANKAGDLNVLGSDDLTITPATATSAVTIDAGLKDRAVGVGGSGDVTLKRLTLRNGLAETGGGVHVWGTGRLVIDSSTILFNGSKWGGGVGVGDGASATLLNSTVYANRATMSGGGVAVGAEGSLAVRSSTIYGNLTDSDASGTGNGGGLSTNVGAGTVRMTNTILAGNEDLTPPPGTVADDCDTGDSFFPRFVLSPQKLGAGPCKVGSNPGSNIQADPKVSGFGYNGGTTPSLSIGLGSPAIDAAGKSDPDLCPPVDQRGEVRNSLKCDIGAFEGDDIDVIVIHPLAPSNLTTDPPIIGATTFPKVKGSAPADTTVKIFATPDCSGPPLASGTAAAFTSPGIPVQVAKKSTTTFRATATNKANVSSACSTSSATYTQKDGEA